jgi:hypothetical protein
MNKPFGIIRIALVSLTICLCTGTALAQNSNQTDSSLQHPPLVVIRFTEKVVPYEGALTRAVSQTESAVPDTIYDIVSIYPNSGNLIYSNDAETEARTQRVIDLITAQNVPENRIRVTKKPSKTAAFQEIHVFLQ